MTTNTLEFRVKRIATNIACDQGLYISPERVRVDEIIDPDLGKRLRIMFHYVVHDEEVYDLPDNWLMRLGRQWARLYIWLRRRFHFLPAPRVTKIWAEHAFPNVALPPEFHDASYVTFRMLSEKE